MLPKLHAKLTPGWVLIRVNFDPIQEIGQKVGGGRSSVSGPFFVRLRYRQVNTSISFASQIQPWITFGSMYRRSMLVGSYHTHYTGIRYTQYTVQPELTDNSHRLVFLLCYIFGALLKVIPLKKLLVMVLAFLASYPGCSSTIATLQNSSR